MRRPWLKRILWLAAALILIAAAGFVIWGLTPSQPMPQALSALESDQAVTVTQGRWLVFSPVQPAQPETGLIFYPGGHVDTRAYAPQAHAVAAQGYLVIIPQMPLNLAVLNVNAADEIIRAYPRVKNWAIGGHSLGGAMAAAFLYQHPQAADGLVLWASYPAAGNSLADSELKVVSISASRDGLSTPAKITASKTLLPVSTRWVQIMGGDHAQFGWYGAQSGDLPAEISREEQQAQTVNATLALLGEIQMVVK
jgi:hypothetical protein